MKALIAGYGGIGANVYYPELEKLGYEIYILDNRIPNATYKNYSEIKTEFDLAIVCLPNFLHGPVAKKLAETGTRKIYIEKPGLESSRNWWNLCDTFPETSFHLVKNNLFRLDYGNTLEHFQNKDVIGVDIQWINDNRIPNPGSWFTDKSKAFGGVSRDLMPHLYCFAVKIFGQKEMMEASVIMKCSTSQRWNLKSITSTDYGTVDSKGIYDVDDTAMATGEIDGVSLKMYATWKDGYNKQSITLYFRDGTTYEWNFGLCPAEAYGVMIQDNIDSKSLDMDIHYFLEGFR